jgi:hypothetical protein
MKKSLLDAIDVASPCGQAWESMHGSDEVRFCDHCAKHVHDLSAITAKEVRRLIVSSDGNICIRYLRNTDGTLKTLRRRLHQISRNTGAAAGVLGTSLTVSAMVYGQNTGISVPQDNSMVAESAIRENGAPGATIFGVITDPNGAVIPFATITVVNTVTGVYQTAPTNSEGYYEFRDLSPGSYKLKVEAAGFAASEVGQAQLTGGMTGKQDVQLAVASVGEQVNVNSSLNSDNSLGGVISSSYVEFISTNKMIRAAQRDDLDEVKRLIGMGKKVNVKNSASEGNFPLHYAVENGNFDMVQTLLNAGARVSVKNFDKRTPLMMLDADATSDLVNLLFSYGASVNAVDKEKNTAIILAAGAASEDVVRVLILNGADVNAQNKKGETALMRAAEEGALENVKALLESGADASLKDRSGQMAWSKTNAEDIKQTLMSYGGIAIQN